MDASLGSALWDFVSAYDNAFTRAAEANGLSSAQACTLTPLTQRAYTMRALADKLGCDASNVTQIAARLEARGLVARERDPDDGRARRLAITTNGRDAQSRVVDDFDFPRSAVSRLTAAEQRDLARMLEKMLAMEPTTHG